MKSILLLDTSVGTMNIGDEIIMKCIRDSLVNITKDAFVLTLPTHVPAFHWYQTIRRSTGVQEFSNINYKFVCGTNLLTMDMFTRYPQWDVNIFNYKPLKNSILVGVGAGKGSEVKAYTKYLYKKVLSHEFVHSVRDERTKNIMDSMGFKSINTGCATLWSLTPEFCRQIPSKKSDSVIFTLTDYSKNGSADQLLIDTLVSSYKKVYFWPQQFGDIPYFSTFKNIENIEVVPPNIDDYSRILKTDIDYVGTRLHGGIYAMRHKKRSIIIIVDERAREMNKSFNLNCIERDELTRLKDIVNSEFRTDIKVNYDSVNTWLSQFISDSSERLA
jgi:polysaccharide pyruvyl transferase WcaK-like protein